MAAIRLDTIAQLSAGDTFLNRYQVVQISYRTNAKLVCRAQDRHDNKPVLLVFENKCSMRVNPDYLLSTFNQRCINVDELPFARICSTMRFSDAHMMVLDDEGPLACQVVHQQGKLTKNEAISMCLSLLYGMKTLAENQLALRDISSSNVICNTKHRIMSKALLTGYPQVYYAYESKYLVAELILLLYMFFDLWATDLGDVYKYHLTQIVQKHSEFSKLVGYVLHLEQRDSEPDFDIVRILFERLID